MNIDVITKTDLDDFRRLLLNDLKNLIDANKASESKWLRSSDVRKMLKISAGTLQNLRISGQLRPSKVGGTFYFKASDIDKLLQSQMK